MKVNIKATSALLSPTDQSLWGQRIKVIMEMGNDLKQWQAKKWKEKQCKQSNHKQVWWRAVQVGGRGVCVSAAVEQRKLEKRGCGSCGDARKSHDGRRRVRQEWWRWSLLLLFRQCNDDGNQQKQGCNVCMTHDDESEYNWDELLIEQVAWWDAQEGPMRKNEKGDKCVVLSAASLVRE